MSTDSDGYLLIEKEFDLGTHHYTFIEDLGQDWHIYQQIREDRKVSSFELVHLERQESYEIAGNVVPKKWTYPGASHWGKRGFTFKSKKECYNKFNQLTASKEPTQIKGFSIPVNQEFVVKDLANELGIDKDELSAYVKSLGDKVKVVGLKKNKKGLSSKILVYSP